jgi:hypothetical protein
MNFISNWGAAIAALDTKGRKVSNLRAFFYYS